jgi:hypothetical protein
VGIEVVSPARPWPLDEILRAYNLSIDDVLQLQALHGVSGVRGHAVPTAGKATTPSAVLVA